ncbi:hypothetical protein KIN20_011736 [Parelaphostrongylus tenuis]|uniref:Uncharacterized protein n=1 Tax=Parelaphostrongylus tenuis TaxID=148309 RepID=A0AAD5MSH7_PARTN|nr:hypothetical protein KIN20_011736 [Parelaphostrongylus tenuis]
MTSDAQTTGWFFNTARSIGGSHKQNEIYDRRLNDLALEEAEYSKLLESQTYELEKVRTDIANQKQKQANTEHSSDVAIAEIEENITSIVHELEEKKVEILRKEEALKTMEEQANSMKE